MYVGVCVCGICGFLSLCWSHTVHSRYTHTHHFCEVCLWRPQNEYIYMWVGCGCVCVGYVGFYLFADFILCTQGTNTAFLWSLPMVTSRWVYMYVGWGVGVCVWGIWVSISMLIAYCALKVHTQHFWAVCLWWPQNEYICLWVGCGWVCGGLWVTVCVHGLVDDCEWVCVIRSIQIWIN